MAVQVSQDAVAQSLPGHRPEPLTHGDRLQVRRDHHRVDGVVAADGAGQVDGLDAGLACVADHVDEELLAERAENDLPSADPECALLAA